MVDRNPLPGRVGRGLGGKTVTASQVLIRKDLAGGGPVTGAGTNRHKEVRNAECGVRSE